MDRRCVWPAIFFVRFSGGFWYCLQNQGWRNEREYLVLDNHWCASVDATIQLRTGCNPLEKHGPQAVVVHVDAWAPMARVADPHDIRQVVDYEVIFLAIRKLEGNPHCECLESSILELMDAVFAMEIVSSAFVSMHKPHVYNGQGTPAISLAMTRQQWAATNR